MATRSGAFGATLDPFGRSRGGLGRYNVTGASIQSLADYEAYAIAVAWANGEASDEAYLASLQKMVELANPGTSEQVTAQNKLDDATYTIGRNAISRDVNNADTPAERVTALQKLLVYDQARLGHMTPDNQAYHDQVDRTAGTRGDIRQSQYSDLVNKVNAGKATTKQLLAMAQGFSVAAATDPDAKDWRETVVSLTDRVADEHLTDSMQAFQHDRLSGTKLLAEMDARLAGLTPGSPSYDQLKRQREDLVENIRITENAKRGATVAGQRQQGKISDHAYLTFLQAEYTNAPAGSTEKIQAGNQLRDFTFSLAEDKLRFDVTKGKRPVSALVSFYKAARATMDPNSERWRALTLTIDSLARGGGSSGGSGGKGGKGLAYYTKQLVADSTITALLGTKTAPKDFGDLLRLDISNTTSRKWWDNNMRSAISAFQTGARTWVYYDKKGNPTELPFHPSMMSQLDNLNYQYTRQALSGAKTVKDAQFWTGMFVSATKSLNTRSGQYTMDVYEKTFGDIGRAKERALAGGRWAEYINLTSEQMDLAHLILGIQPGVPLDVNYATNAGLTAAQRSRISADLASIAPQNVDPLSDGYNPHGDAVLRMVNENKIELVVDAHGEIVSGTLDPRHGYLTQTSSGRVALVPVDMTEPGQSVPAADTGIDEPAYLSQTAAAVIRIDGQDIAVRQPIADGGALIPVFSSRPPAASGPGVTTNGLVAYPTPGPIPGPVAGVDAYVVAGQQMNLPIRTFTTLEGTTAVRWVSLDGKTWVRYIPGMGPTPRVVLPADIKFNPTTKTWQRGDKDLEPGDFVKEAHWWGTGESKAVGAAWGQGAPGTSFVTRTMRPDGQLDTRPDSAVGEVARLGHAKGAGPLEFDTSDAATIRGYYFGDTGAGVTSGFQPLVYDDERGGQNRVVGGTAAAAVVRGARVDPAAGKGLSAAQQRVLAAQDLTARAPWSSGLNPIGSRPTPGGYPGMNNLTPVARPAQNPQVPVMPRLSVVTPQTAPLLAPAVASTIDFASLSRQAAATAAAAKAATKAAADKATAATIAAALKAADAAALKSASQGASVRGMTGTHPGGGGAQEY